MSPRVPSLIRPPALKPGDTVAIAALSSELDADSLEKYRAGVAELEALGFRVRAAPLVEVGKRWWWAAAQPAEVAEEVNALFRDPDVHAIWALTGGRFTLSYLDALAYDAIAANPKPLIGMSDNDAIVLAIHSRTGLVTFHGDNAIDGMGDWHALPALDRARHADAYRRVLSSTEPAGPLPALSRWETWRPGRAEGHLLGGLLPRFLRIQATPWAFAPERFDGAILFLEELAQPTINVWNDLQVLRHGGILDRIAGLLIGPVETVSIAEYAPQTLREVVLNVLGDRDIPIMGNVNFGHADPNLLLPLGVRAAMDADALTLGLLEPAVS
jgi:muramoyltetrapeptide carboxypeptidase LdcA involved in peptidoglycan recycling